MSGIFRPAKQQSFGWSKPDLRIYELLLERYHLNADECLFIDDSLDNINACKNVGMDGIHLPNHSKLEEKLKEHHII